MPIASHKKSRLLEVVDDPDADNFEPPTLYKVSSYGADLDVEGLVRRIDREEILIPDFQRKFVWTIKEASRFIESLLLGLPVPGIFMAREEHSNKMLVIDGQQRLRSLEFFYSGYFNPSAAGSHEKVFRLSHVQKPFAGRSYSNLEDSDRRQLDNAIVHATIVKQDSPADDNTSLFHIFSRLNSGGVRLAAQEIRVATYRGKLIEFIRELNDTPAWRRVYGAPSHRLKDQELILRFFAFYYESKDYKPPLGEFLNRFASSHKGISSSEQRKWAAKFTETIEVIEAALGRGAFRLERTINAAVFDSVSVGVARRLDKGKITDFAGMKHVLANLSENLAFNLAVSRATADEVRVDTRLRMATKAFAGVA